jgi:hypothetical protein
MTDTRKMADMMRPMIKPNIWRFVYPLSDVLECIVEYAS